MATTMHKKKTTAKDMAKKKRKMGLNATVNKVKGGYSVSSTRKK